MKGFDEYKIKHLEFIQSVINRMASNSFAMKGWMIAIVAALLALYADSEPNNESYLLIAVGVVSLFWIIDSYYLYVEKKYVDLYNDIIHGKSKIMDFDLSTKKYSNICKFFDAMFCSVSTILLYLPIVIILWIFAV